MSAGAASYSTSPTPGPSPSPRDRAGIDTKAAQGAQEARHRRSGRRDRRPALPPFLGGPIAMIDNGWCFACGAVDGTVRWVKRCQVHLCKPCRGLNTGTLSRSRLL